MERFADESRYAAVVRERLKLARALHDTLAHSMMAIISEIRVTRRLQMHDPAAVPEELGRAEELAHLGLSDARTRRQGHYGLVGLREQAEMIGALLDIDSESGMPVSFESTIIRT